MFQEPKLLESITGSHITIVNQTKTDEICSSKNARMEWLKEKGHNCSNDDLKLKQDKC